MPYTDTLYWVRFISPTTGHQITHAGMTWDSYHSMVADLAVRGIAYTTGEEKMGVVAVNDELGLAGSR